MDTLDNFFNNTTSQFYVVLTATSSFLSGLMMFLEWLHYTYFGISIVDRLSSLVVQVFPFFASSKGKESTTSSKSKKVADIKPFKNSLVLFRGAEYNRYYQETGREPLTEYDIAMTYQDLQNVYFYDGPRVDSDQSEQFIASIWKESDRANRIEFARKALEINPNSPMALIILAEEEAPTILEVEEKFKLALKSAEMVYKNSHNLCLHDPMYKPLHERNAYVCSYCRIRLALCARKLGKLKEASKMYRDLSKDERAQMITNVHENLIECLLETQNYFDLQQLMNKLEDVKYTVMSYTVALLKIKQIGEKFCPDAVSKRGPTQPELNAIEAIHYAVELNPHVPKYLLELKSLVLPPEHYFRRGDSEAVVYAFHHLRHWKRIDGALSLLSSTWEGTFRQIPFPLERGHHFPPYPSNMEAADRQVLPPHHELSVFPQKDAPFFMVFTGVLCFSFMTLTVVAYHFPRAMTQYARMVTTVFLMVLEKLMPTDFFGFFS